VSVRGAIAATEFTTGDLGYRVRVDSIEPISGTGGGFHFSKLKKKRKARAERFQTEFQG
jgi:hypothetical protein